MFCIRVRRCPSAPRSAPVPPRSTAAPRQRPSAPFGRSTAAPRQRPSAPRSAPPPLKTTGAGGGADASTRGFGGGHRGLRLSRASLRAIRQTRLSANRLCPTRQVHQPSISIALPCRSAALRNDNSELSNITHCVKKYSPSALVITHRVMRPSQAVARPCLHRNGAMVCSKGAQ
jgi:hypothetical protein